MPSPFIGMDPFLEDPAVFPDLHDSLITYLRESLNAQLPAPYYAAIASRVWVEVTERRIEPDVNLLRPGRTMPGGGIDAGGGVAVAQAVQAEPVVVHVPLQEIQETEIRETFLEVYAQPGGERLVTTLEVLSLSNKTPGAHGRESYLKKQREILDSQVHLVEIDLLRGGVHSTAVPRDHAVARAGAFDYHVCIHRFDRREDFFVYPIRLGGRLPTVAIPLLPGDPAAGVGLQAVLDRCYDTGQYRRRIRYRGRVPVPPLGPEQAGWAEKTLREKGLLEPS
jgi:hypothetical protein